MPPLIFCSFARFYRNFYLFSCKFHHFYVNFTICFRKCRPFGSATQGDSPTLPPSERHWVTDLNLSLSLQEQQRVMSRSKKDEEEVLQLRHKLNRDEERIRSLEQQVFLHPPSIYFLATLTHTRTHRYYFSDNFCRHSDSVVDEDDNQR